MRTGIERIQPPWRETTRLQMKAPTAALLGCRSLAEGEFAQSARLEQAIKANLGGLDYGG